MHNPYYFYVIKEVAVRACVAVGESLAKTERARKKDQTNKQGEEKNRCCCCCCCCYYITFSLFSRY